MTVHSDQFSIASPELVSLVLCPLNSGVPIMTIHSDQFIIVSPELHALVDRI